MIDPATYLDTHYPFIWPDAEKFFTEYKIPLALSALAYLPLVFVGQKLMKTKQPYNFSLILAAWNFLLGAGSALAGYYVISTLFHRIIETNFSISEITCDKLCYIQHASTSRWVFFFNLSKVFEFVDTWFLILRKKPIVFLHYYHHIATFLYCWYANQNMRGVNCGGWWFAAMNLFVHSVMYTYYGLMSLTWFKPYVSKINYFVTILQISQMFAGCYFLYVGTLCPNFIANDTFWIPFCMYASYLLLFVKFFVEKYVFRSLSGGKEKLE